MENIYIASLMQKHYIGENRCVYNFLHNVVGTIDQETGVFIDNENNKYVDITNKESLNPANRYNITRVISLNDLNEKYNTNPNSNMTFNDVLKCYDNDVKNKVYITFLNEDDKIFYFNFEFASKSQINIPEAKSNITKEIEESIDEVDNELELDAEDELVNEDITKVISDVIAGNYSLEELKELQERYTNKQEEIEGVLDSIDLSIETMEYDGMQEQGCQNIKKDKHKELGIININELYNKITKTLIAQDEPALRVIAEIASLDICNDNKYGILITGSPGVGKTKLMSLIAKHLDRPFITIDSTQLTCPGFSGKDIEECLWELYEKCNFNKEQAEHAIVFFDEIDKKNSSSKSDPSGKKVLDVLLKFLDGTTYIACENTQSKKDDTYAPINTSNMTVVFGGAYADVYNSRNKITGFNTQEETSKIVTVEDFVEKGNMTYEFMRRTPVVIHLNDLYANDYKKLLIDSDESPLIYEIFKFKEMNVKLNFSDKYIEKLAERAYSKKIGVSGLTSIIRESIWYCETLVNANLDFFEEITITEETIDDNKNFQFVKKNI